MKSGQKAWLLTWEWAGKHAAVEDRIAAILRPRMSPKSVGEMVENLYAIHEYSPTELARWSKHPEENPYKAQWHEGYCICGHNPSLHAYSVHDLVIAVDPESGLETITWILSPRNKRYNLTGQREQVRGELQNSIRRTITGPFSSREIGRNKPDAE